MDMINAFPVLLGAMFTLLPTILWATEDYPETNSREILRTVELCEVCHGNGGRRIGEHFAPDLTGQNLHYMLKSLNDLAEGNRPSPTGMRSMSQILKDRPELYLKAVLQHLARQTDRVSRIRSGEEATNADVAAGKQLADAICAACHGRDGRASGLFSHTPNLLGQDQEYIKHQLRYFKEDDPQRRDHTMNAIVKQLTAQDVENVAAYYESLASGVTQ